MSPLLSLAADFVPIGQAFLPLSPIGYSFSRLFSDCSLLYLPTFLKGHLLMNSRILYHWLLLNMFLLLSEAFVPPFLLTFSYSSFLLLILIERQNVLYCKADLLKVIEVRAGFLLDDGIRAAFL